MTVVLTIAAGPTLVPGDTLAPVLVLHRDTDGEVTSRCPHCRQPVTDSVGADGGPHRAQLFGDIAYGTGICVPCGHSIGAITIKAQP